VTRRLLNLVSMVLLTTVTMVSAARVVCLLPCFTVQTAEATGHCAHSTPDDVDRLSAQPGACGDCEQVTLEDADRLPSRHTATGPHAVATVTPLQPAVALPPVHMSAVAPAPPRGPSPGRAPVPLRI
jgi:hypothetical protein